MLLLITPFSLESAELKVTVEQVANRNGYILVALCTPETFLRAGCPYTGRVPAITGDTEVVVRDVAPGIYALQAFHDENDNLDLDRNFFGMPQEGMGFGNDAKMRFGPPHFGDATINVPASGATTFLRLRYYD